MTKTVKQATLIRAPYMASRTVPVPLDASGLPASLDEATRSVEVIASTEAPASVMDWERWEVVREVLLMSGCRIPASGQLVLLDTHSRESVNRVLGSFRSARIAATEHGPALVGRTHYSTVEEADNAFTKVKEGHVTDVSIGYEVLAHIWVKEGESVSLEGKTFDGPLRIGVEWVPRELSLCPIGADANAKIRNQQPPRAARTHRACGHNKEKVMVKEKAGGNKTAKTEKRSGILARLRSVMTALGLRAEEEIPEEERQDVELVDENGNPIEPAELTEEELITVVEGLEEVLAEAEEELATQEEETAPAEEQGKASANLGKQGRQGKRAFVFHSGSGRILSPTQAARAERSRVLAIQNMARAHNVPEETTTQLIESGTSLTAAKAKVFDMRTQTQTTGPGFRVSMGNTEQEKFRAAVQDALSLRCGHKVEKPAEGATELQSYSLREMSREMLVRSGQRPDGHIVQIVGRALATTDLPQLLVETSRRTLMEAFEAADETWRTWAGTGTATDFKKSTALGLEGEVKPVLKPEGGEYKEGKLAENAEEYKIATYGRKMVITREAIINDDLNALTALPRMYGEATAEMVGDVAYKALLDMPNIMGDGNPLFGTTHKNLYTGLGGVPTVANLGEVVTGMKLQKDSFGKTITIQPKFFLAPVALEVASEQFFNTQLQGAGSILGTGANPLVNNPYGGNFFTRVYDRRMDAAGANTYYLAAARSTVVVFFLGGIESPYIEEQINFDTDGVESKVRMDVGAKAMRWVTLAKATG